MSIKECQDLVEEYVGWLRQQITVTDLGNACEITTPFLDRHNDFLQIYVVRENSNYILTDDGYILADLRMSGVDLNTEKRIDTLNTMLRGFGVEQNGGQLRVIAQKGNLAQRKHALVQAMLAVNDLFLVAQPRVSSFFLEDVERYLQLNDVRFIPSISFVGRSGYTHHFDFAIPRSKVAPERLIKAINTPSRENITAMIFSWDDTKGARTPDTQAFVFLNDEHRAVSEESISALNSYNIGAIPWSRREEKIEYLAA